MKIKSGKETLMFLAGDIACFVAALWLALLVRAQGAVPSGEFELHLVPFLYIFLVWIFVFLVFDLYRRPTGIFRRNLPVTILRAQIVNTIIAFAFFYLIPYYNLTPKTILFLDLVFSFSLLYLWRRFIAERLFVRRKERIYFACRGPEVEEIINELRSTRAYNVKIIDAPDSAAARALKPTIVVIDPHNETTTRSLGDFYRMFFDGTRFVNIFNLYEDLFDRIPLSIITEHWFLENVSNDSKFGYDVFKRAMDISISLVLGVISLVFYPFVWLALKLDDRGPLFSIQERVGRNNKLIKLYKFRTMTNANDKAQWGAHNTNKVTRVGVFLRKSRIDELPQLWNVFTGDISIIGPRPEFPDPVKQYEQEIPYYSMRHIIKPGLSGWAQVYHENHPHHGIKAVERNREKLSYDLYYIKHRSIWLDIKITLHTIKIMLSLAGA